MVNVRDDSERFREAGGNVAVITMGTPEQVAEFRDRMQLPFACFADPQREAYKAFGLQQGSLQQIAGPAVWARSAFALIRHGGGRPIGDPLQLHGAFVVDSGGVICFSHYPRHSADQPSHEEMILALRDASNGVKR